MYDFWYTLGVATIDPKILKPLTKIAKFTDVDRKVVETIGCVTKERRGPHTGLVERDATTKMRVAIFAALKKASGTAPPVGIYTAGRLCQLLSIPFFDSDHQKESTFLGIMDLSHHAFKIASKKVGAPKKLGTLPALMGLCLVDAQLADLIQKYPKLPENKPTPHVTRFLTKTMLGEMLDEFGIKVNSKAFKFMRAYVATNQFDTAARFLMVGDENPWNEEGNTLEQMIFWPDDGSLRGEHVVA